MKMHKFHSNKLWRDKVIDTMEKMGSVIHWQRLNDTEYDAQLRAKLLEETDEVRTAHSREDLIHELADVSEVIDALCTLHNLSK